MLALSLVAAGLIAQAPAPTVLSARSPAPLALLLVTPTGEPGRVSRSEALRALEAVLDTRTELRAVALDPSVNEACRGRLGCIVDATRSALSEASWLLVVTQITLEGEPDRVRALLLDLRALPLDPDEDAIDAASVRAEAREVATAEALRAVFARAFAGPFRPPLARAGRVRAQGRVRLAPTVPGALVHVDGRPVGTTGPGPTRIRGLAPGRHELRLTAPGRSPWAAEVEVASGPALLLEPELAPRPSARRDAVRAGLAIGGAATALAGGALLAVAFADASSDVKTACFTSRPDCAGGQGFASFGYDASADRPEDVNPSGLGPGPVGAALAVMGTGVALGALFEEGETPWWSLGLSVAAGGAVLGAALVLDGGDLP